MKYFTKSCHVAAVLAALTFLGCNQTPADSAAENSAATEVQAVVDDHSGWWCNPHGVPEGECTRCHANLVAGFKEKGDWCDEHERPDSQCFQCHPELEAKFIARFEAKFGNKPPKPSHP
jgi:cobalt-zinc-cadmium efflux system membrane fusion protein